MMPGCPLNCIKLTPNFRPQSSILWCEIGSTAKRESRFFNLLNIVGGYTENYVPEETGNKGLVRFSIKFACKNIVFLSD